MRISIPEDAIEVGKREFERICASFSARHTRFVDDITQYESPAWWPEIIGYEDEKTGKFYIDKNFAKNHLKEEK